VCAGLCVWMVVQFEGFYREYQTTYPLRASMWFDGNHPGAFEPIVREYASDNRRFIYLSKELPRIREQWKLYLLAHGRKDLLPRTIVFTQEDLHLGAVRPGSFLLTGANSPVERSFREMPEVQVVHSITEPDGTPTFTLFERTEHSVLHPFDGVYSAQVKLACAAGGARNDCASLATTAACPSMETITVANNLVLDSCGYLRQGPISEDGLYRGTSTTLSIPLEGQFSTTATFPLSGSVMDGANQYQLTFVVTKTK
jgi:hypothetical protein